MKKTVGLLFIIPSLFLVFSACTLHIPYDFGGGYQSLRIIFDVKPEDAKILLNGKFIGEAYEFSSEESALRLSSKDNEIVVKREGYVEIPVDLYEYASRDITVKLKMLREKKYYGGKEREYADSENQGRESRKPLKPREPREPREVKPIAKSEPVKEPVAVPPEEDQDIPEGVEIQVVSLILEILPPESAIYLDGKFWGIAPENGRIENLRLKPGKYTLEVAKPGYKSFKKELDIKDQKNLKITIILEK